MISRIARAWRRGVAGMARSAVGAGIGRAGDVGRCRRRRSPGCSRSGPPTARRWRRGAAAPASPLPSAVRPGQRSGDATSATTGSRPTSSSSAASERRPGHDRVDLEVLLRRVVHARRSGPRPSIVGTPIPDVVFASEAPPVATSFVSNPRRAGERDDVVGEAARSARASPSAPSCASSRRRRSRPARPASAASSAIAPERRAERLGGHRPDVDLELGLVAHDVRPRAGLEHADVRGDVRPAAVERVDPADELGAGDDRAAALLRLDAGVRGPPVDRAGGGRPCPCAPTRSRRSRGRTRGRSRRRRLARRSTMCGVDDGEPISSSGLATNVDPLERQRVEGRPAAAQRGDRPEAGEQPGLHVADARRPARSPPSIRNGRFATVPSAKTVSMWPISRSRGPAPGRALERPDDGVAEPAARVRAAARPCAPSALELGRDPGRRPR